MRISTLTTPLGPAYLSLKQIEGKEQLNTLFRYVLQAYSIHDDIAANSLLGQSVSVSIDDQHGNPVHLNAIVAQFKRLGRKRGARYTQYEAVLVPWLWIAQHRVECRVFENLTALEIIIEVLGFYPFPVSCKTGGGRKILHEVQYNESDFAFVCRLMEEHGINYQFSHEADRHTLVLSESVSAFGVVPGHDIIPFRAADHLGVADEETISTWVTSQTITPGYFTTSDFDFREPGARLESSSSGSYPVRKHAFADLPVYLWMGQQHYTELQTGSSIAGLRQDQQEQDFARTEADSDVRALLMGATGLGFTLSKHVERAFNEAVTLLTTEMFFKENPGATDGGGDHTEWRVRITVISGKYKYRPQRVTPLPYIRGPQTAIVVGPAGQEVWLNDLGMVKIRLWWDRNTPGNGWELWVRVSSGWAGNGLGDKFHPRIGDEVIILFLEGNPSRPIIVGRVANANRLPPKFSNTGSLPTNYALAGIKSREFGGYGYNQLLMDDTTGQLRAQLESEHGKTQLNIGYLTHPRDASAAPRGDGFELRSDHAGALRATQGLLLTTDGQPAAMGAQLERKELNARLARAEAIVKQLSDLSNTHQADDTNQDGIKALVKAVLDWDKGSNLAPKASQGGAPTLAATSPAYLTLASDKGTTIATGANLDLVPALDCNLSVGRRLAVRVANAISLFSYKLGIKMIAASGDITVQAQKDKVSVGAAKGVHVYTVEGGVVMEAPTITMRTPGAEITLGGGNIEAKCTGTFTQKAANFAMLGPAGATVNPPPMPTAKLKTDELFVLHYRGSHAPAKNRRYQVTLDDGRVISGVSDGAGKTSVAAGDAMHIAELIIFNE